VWGLTQSEKSKAKDELINQIKYEGFQYDVEAPIRPQTISETLPNEVEGNFGMDQMTAAEYNEYLEKNFLEDCRENYGKYWEWVKGGRQMPKIEIIREVN
jgi:hypothetical protein